MAEQMTLRGTLKGHNGWVTQIATTPQRPDMILSSSRGKNDPVFFVYHCQLVFANYNRVYG